MEAKQSSESKKVETKKLAPDVYAPPLWLKIIAPVGGAIAAASMFFVRVSHEFYKKETHKPGGKDLKMLRHESINALNQMYHDHNLVEAAAGAVSASDAPYRATLRAAAGGITPVHGTVLDKTVQTMVGVGEDALTKLSQNVTSKTEWGLQQQRVYQEYNRAFDTLLESKGVHTKGIKRLFQGTWQRWAHVGTDSRTGILVGAALSAGAVVASLFMLNLNTRLRMELRDIHGKLGDLAAGSDGNDFPDRAPLIKENALVRDSTPSPMVDAQTARHDRSIHTQVEQARA